MSPQASAADLAARRARNEAMVARPSSSGRVRFLVSLGAGVVAAVAGSLAVGPRYGVVVGLIVTAAAYVVWTYLALRRFDGHATKLHAHQEDAGAALSDVGGAIVILANLGAVGTLLVLDRTKTTQTADAVLALAAVLLSWFLLHTLYVARYARLYYTDDADPATPDNPQPLPVPGAPEHPPVVAGIDFNSDGYWPAYGDFTYFAFNLGMTFQVSDTSVSDPRIRRLVLHHCLLSYFFATAITATVLNLVIGLVS